MAKSRRRGRMLRAVPWCCLSLFAVVVVCGCGGGNNTASPSPTPPSSPPPADTSSVPPAGAGGSASTPAVAADQASQAKNQWPATLPDDVSTWDRKQYFYKARWEGDPRLKDAVEHVAKRFARG